MFFRRKMYEAKTSIKVEGITGIYDYDYDSESEDKYERVGRVDIYKCVVKVKINNTLYNVCIDGVFHLYQNYDRVDNEYTYTYEPSRNYLSFDYDFDIPMIIKDKDTSNAEFCKNDKWNIYYNNFNVLDTFTDSKINDLKEALSNYFDEDDGKTFIEYDNAHDNTIATELYKWMQF